MTNITAHRVFNWTGANYEPFPNETVWDWALRVTGNDSNLRSHDGMQLLWSHAHLWDHTCGLTAAECSHNTDDPSLLDTLFDSRNILMWGNTVFFSDEETMVVFKLAYSKYIKNCTIVERKINVADD